MNRADPFPMGTSQKAGIQQKDRYSDASRLNERSRTQSAYREGSAAEKDEQARRTRAKDSLRRDEKGKSAESADEAGNGLAFNDYLQAAKKASENPEAKSQDNAMSGSASGAEGKKAKGESALNLLASARKASSRTAGSDGSADSPGKPDAGKETKDAQGGSPAAQARNGGKLKAALAELENAAKLEMKEKAAGKARGLEDGIEAASLSKSGLEAAAAEAFDKAKIEKKGVKDKEAEGAEAAALGEGGKAEGKTHDPGELSAAAEAVKAASAKAASASAEDGVAKKDASSGKDARVSVTDLRKAGSKRGSASASGDSTAAEKAGLASAQSPEHKEKVAELELRLDAGAASGQGGKGEGLASEARGSGTSVPARDFSSMLSEQLKAGWNNDIVQSAHIVLREGDSGTIKLRLHPDSLGGVKIELNLADNSISGKIIVESDEAKTAFEKNLSQLHDAFTQGGFDSAKLEVQVGSGNANEAGGEGGKAREPFWSERRGIDSLAKAVPEASGPAYQGRPRSAVDILA